MQALRHHLSRLPSLASDTVLTLLAALFAAANLLLIPPREARPGLWVVVLALLCAVVLLFRMRWPVLTLITIGVLGTLFVAVSRFPFAIVPMAVIALYSAVAYSTIPRQWVWTAAISVAVALTLITLVCGHGGLDAHLTPVLLNGGWMAMGLLLGEALRSHHDLVQEAELRAVQAERTQQEIAQRRVIEERLQMARELHDILAHSVALINVQAGVAAHVIDQHPEQAREALTHIKTASHATLQELRSMVGVLRAGDGSAPRTPAPGLDALGDLVQTVRDAGIDVQMDVDPSSGPLPATVDVAAYRILQEALTNVIKHAGPAAVRVGVHRDGRQLAVEIVNSAGARPSMFDGAGAGQGIAGMRERAASLGGTLQAGPRPDGGFQVRATLPLRGDAA